MFRLAWKRGKDDRPGQYRGYAEETFDGYERTSQHVAVRDGTRLAVDMSCEFDVHAFAVPGGMAPPPGVPSRFPPQRLQGGTHPANRALCEWIPTEPE